jgi:uncharacterized repeat protein (TIGR02543 family)
VAKDTTLYAKWIPRTYKVAFNTKGGNEIAAIGVNYDSILPDIESPVLTGYSFLGWFKDNDCTQKWKMSSDHVTETTTLYAKWKTV